MNKLVYTGNLPYTAYKPFWRINMRNLLLSGLLFMVMLSGCGNPGNPTLKASNIIPPDSIVVNAALPTIANITSTLLTVKGNFSVLHLQNQDITDQASFTSSDTTIAAFNVSGAPNRIRAISPGVVTITATVKGVTNTCQLTVSSATISSMAITPATSSNPSVAKGPNPPTTVSIADNVTSKLFSVTGTFSDSTTQDLTYDATWSSSDATVAVVSNTVGTKGVVSGIAKGTANILASFDGKSDSAMLTVTDPVLVSIAVTPANSSIAGISKTVNFTATGTYSDGSTKDITISATWSSSQTAIATISSTASTSPIVATTVAVGTTSISATLGGINGNTNLTVTALNVTGLSIVPATITLTAGNNSTPVVVNATLSNGTTEAVTSSVTWTSDFPGIVSASGGTITRVAGAIGTATLTATYSGKTASVTVTAQ
jgi:hypothetical protein